MHVNPNFEKLPGSYLFAEIARRVKAYQEEHPEADLIRLGIGDVTKPLVPAVIEALHKAVDEMGVEETFKGYGPDFGYDFLINAIREGDYTSRGIDVAYDEILESVVHKLGVDCKCEEREISGIRANVSRGESQHHHSHHDHHHHED